MSEPLVSVLIPTRDRAAWLEEALASVFAQSLADFEIVVADDASTDGTRDLVASRRDARLVYLRHDEPRGVAANRNACFGAARGRFVGWLDSDDRYLPRMLETQVARLEREPRVAFAHGGVEVIDAEGSALPDWPAPFATDTIESGPAALLELATGNYVAAPTVLVRRSAQIAAGPYRETLASGEDWEMWMRLALHGDVAYTAEKLAQYRWHASSLARSAEISGQRFDRELEALRGLFADEAADLPGAGELARRARAALAARALNSATECLTRGSRWAALARLLAAARAWPELRRGLRFARLAVSALSSDDFPWHARSRAALAGLLRVIGDCRAGRRLRRLVETPRRWRETLAGIALTLRSVTPESARLAVVDKWDPTLLHLAERRGWHFPDRRTMPEYPRDSAAAVRHLAELVRRGAEYFVLPVNSFWWLDAYPGLTRHLAREANEIWADDHCRIYRLSAPGAR